MNISAKTEYACLAVLVLAARHDSGEPVRIREIADAHGIPPQFLVQILLQLKAAGIVTSTRGAAGGYRLARDPRDISLGDVMAIIDGQSAGVSSNIASPTETSQALLDVWTRVDAAEREMLADVSFADLVEQARGHSEHMYYI